MIIQNKKIIASILFLLISFVNVGQTTDVPPPSSTPGPPGLPVDAGIYILLVIGLIYGAVKTIYSKA